MSIKKRKDTEENRAFWAFVEETSRSVEEHFPAWKRGDGFQEPSEGINGNSSQILSSANKDPQTGMKCD